MLTVFYFGTANYKLLPNKAIKPKMDEHTNTHTYTHKTVTKHTECQSSGSSNKWNEMKQETKEMTTTTTATTKNWRKLANSIPPFHTHTQPTKYSSLLFCLFFVYLFLSCIVLYFVNCVYLMYVWPTVVRPIAYGKENISMIFFLVKMKLRNFCELFLPKTIKMKLIWQEIE